MTHGFREEHLDDICFNCREPSGSEGKFHAQNGRIYNIKDCSNCGYEIIRNEKQKTFTVKWEMSRK